MQSSYDTQTSHHKEDLYDLDIEIKTASTQENVDLESTRWNCFPTCGTINFCRG